MFAQLRVVVVGLLSLVLIACGSDNDDPGTGTASIRVLHGVADAPRVNVFLNDDLVLGDVDFRVASPFIPVNAGSYDVRVEAIAPGGDIVVIDVDE